VLAGKRQRCQRDAGAAMGLGGDRHPRLETAISLAGKGARAAPPELFKEPPGELEHCWAVSAPRERLVPRQLGVVVAGALASYRVTNGRKDRWGVTALACGCRRRATPAFLRGSSAWSWNENIR